MQPTTSPKDPPPSAPERSPRRPIRRTLAGVLCIAALCYSAVLVHRERAAASGSHTHDTTTIGEYLASFWGEDWEWVQRLPEVSKLDLAQVIDRDRVPTWDERKKTIEADFLSGSAGFIQYATDHARNWGTEEVDPRGPRFNPDGKVLQPDEVEEAHRIADEFLSDLHLLAEWHATVLARLAREAWEQSRIVGTPFACVDRTPASGRRPLYLCVYAFPVWFVEYAVYEGESPELEAVLTEIASTKAKRSLAVREYIEGVPDRRAPMSFKEEERG